jgi:valyl-tRNA synthetase
MGWPSPKAFPETEGLLEKFNPSSVLCTGRDIITLWVSRMVMFNRYFRDGTLPFTEVYINPMIQDGFGQRMSKSLGNGVDPRDIIGTHGADAMRYTMAQLATGTQDVRLAVDLICPYSGISFTPDFVESNTGHQVMAPLQTSPKDSSNKLSTLYGLLIGEVENSKETPLAVNSSSRFDIGRNFANKFWNGCRFALMNITEPSKSVSLCDIAPVDQWMLSKVAFATTKVDASLKSYQFNSVVESIYDVLWRDLCDWYLEAIKPTIKENLTQQRVLLTVVDVICRLLHPICPFVTEAIWPHIHSFPEGKVQNINLATSPLVATSSWPDLSKLQLNEETVNSFEQVRSLVTAIRGARASQNVKPKRKIDLFASKTMHDLSLEHEAIVKSLAGLNSISKLSDSSKGFAVLVDGERVLLDNMFDENELEDNNARLLEEIVLLEKKIDGFKNRLANDSYVNNAPEHVVQETRDMLAKCEAELVSAKESLC